MKELMHWSKKIKTAEIHEAEAVRLRGSAERSRCKAENSSGVRCTADAEQEPKHVHRILSEEIYP